ncbi:MAG: hypothetical protein INR70_08785 [Parafilimonas terrae]|nr:hypothetical protein [Parafilimonas terrae]
MNDASELLAGRIRAEAPVRSGRTKASVKVNPPRFRRKRFLTQTVDVGRTDKKMIAQLEYGNEHEPANPFILRAADATTPAMVAMIERALGGITEGSLSSIKSV